MTKLIEAVKVNNIEEVKKLIEAGEVISARDERNWSALDWASRENHIEIAKILVNSGANLEEGIEEGRHVTDMAADNGSIEIFNFIHARLKMKVSYKKIGSYLAVKVPFEIKDNFKKIFESYKWDNLGKVWEIDSLDEQKLLDNINALNKRMRQIKVKELKDAIDGGDVQEVKKLVNSAVDVIVKFKDGSTILDAAKKVGDDKIIKMLIDAGADINLHKK